MLEDEQEKKAAEEQTQMLAERLNIENYYTISSKTGKDVHILTNQLLNLAYMFNRELLNKSTPF